MTGSVDCLDEVNSLFHFGENPSRYGVDTFLERRMDGRTNGTDERTDGHTIMTKTICLPSRG